MLLTNTDLPVLTFSELSRAYEDLRDRLAGYNGVHGARLHARLQAIVDELHTRACRENVARSMTSDDLQDMLPDFEQVAALCGVRLEQAQVNREIVIAELRRRAAES